MPNQLVIKALYIGNIIISKFNFFLKYKSLSGIILNINYGEFIP